MFKQLQKLILSRYGDWSPDAVLTQLDAWDWLRLRQEISFISALEPADATLLRDLICTFLEQKTITGIDIELKDWQRQWIAAYACLPILHLGLRAYRDWQTILVYPDTFVPDQEWIDADGIHHHAQIPHAGQAWDRGPVILSWNDVAEDGAVIVHEMVHTLDAANGEANGFPLLHYDMDAVQWSKDFNQAYSALCQRVERDQETPIDPYACTDPAEFFAVVCEYFFFDPIYLRKVMPIIYHHLCAYFRQEPHLRVASAIDQDGDIETGGAY